MIDHDQMTTVPQYKWAEEVKKLYDFTCVNCEKTMTGRMMHAHHIVPKHQDKELANVLENGVALCILCHRYGIHDGCGGISKSARGKNIAAKINETKENEIILTIPKGEKDTIKDHAESMGESVNAFIKRAIDETMARDKQKEG